VGWPAVAWPLSEAREGQSIKHSEREGGIFRWRRKKIVILRHGEKPGNPDSTAEPDLAPAGVERAKELVRVIPADFGNPDFLVAAASSSTSRRPVETLQPLAASLGFGADKVIQTYANRDFLVLAGDLLSNSKFASKLVIVCWHHGNIPGLATALGVTPKQMATAPEYNPKKGKWNSAVFDRFWILDYSDPAGMTFQSVAQNIPAVAAG
jgi:Histidine phosphatase superfamily (branch 1)